METTLTNQAQENKVIAIKAIFIGVATGLGPLMVATIIMAIIDNESGPTFPYDLIHGGFTALCFFICAIVSSTLTHRYFNKSVSCK